MRALVLDEDTKQKIERLKAHAEANRIDVVHLKKTMTGDYPPAGDYPDFKVLIPNGFRVVYSIEEQPIGWCGHLSVSVDSPEKVPGIPAVEAIMAEFGMGKDINNCLNVWIEETEPRAVNVLTKLEGE